MRLLQLITLIGAATPALSCEGDSSNCYGPVQPAAHVRNVRRMQPEAQNATTSPRKELEWGQINFLHTTGDSITPINRLVHLTFPTDTHGWLAGHLKEQNYGADWGDYQSFVADMRKKADKLDVDL